MVGMIMTLFIAIVFTVVEPANSQDINISEEQASLLLKNVLYLTADQTKSHLTINLTASLVSSFRISLKKKVLVSWTECLP
jgi:hypothetical protein